MENSNYPGLAFNRGELSAAMEEYYSDLREFITQPAFQAIFAEMMDLQPSDRPAFVRKVWLDFDELNKRGLQVPEGILIQTSAFGDRRPTLFVVKKFLPERFHGAWENVNWTFNNEFNDEDVPSDPENSWRLPLAVNVQNALMAGGVDLQTVPDDDNSILQALEGNDIIRSEKRPER